MTNTFKIRLQYLLHWGIALVWLINGLYCKVLNLVPRHRLIVGEILGNEHAALLTTTIGITEILMVVWILSKIQPKWCAIVQIATIATMNVIEFTMVPHLLLFGKGNILLAAILIVCIYTHYLLSTSPKST